MFPRVVRTVARRAWVMWGLGVFAYTVAVSHRASLGVAGLGAQQRFGIGLFGVLVTRRQVRRRRNVVVDAFPRAVVRRLAAARS